MDIEEVRIYCLNKKGVTEDMAFGPDTLLFRLCNKIFACIDLKRPNLVVAKMEEETALELRERYRGIVGAWHWNKKHWSDVSLDADVEENLVKKILDDSYELIRTKLPKKTLYNFSDLPDGWFHEHYPELTSAMDVLHDADFRQHQERFQLVTTDYQTSGRGQGMNIWESENQKNLLFAIRFFPTWLKAVDQFRLLQAISLAVARALEKFCHKQIKIKWPNDIYCEDKKICGILIEHDLCGAYLSETRCGIGININQTTFVSSAPNPASLAQLTGREMDRAAVLRNFIKEFQHIYMNMQNGDIDDPVFEYLLHLYRLDGWYSFRDKDGVFEARLDAVLDDGRLRLMDRNGGYRCYAHKEVEYILTKSDETQSVEPFDEDLKKYE